MRETYEFLIDGEGFHLVVDDGAVQPRAGRARDAALILSMSAGTLLDLLSGALAPLDALGGGRVEVQGPAAALERCVAIVAGPQPASAPSPA